MENGQLKGGWASERKVSLFLGTDAADGVGTEVAHHLEGLK